MIVAPGPRPARACDDAQASDQMAEDLLCIFGVPAAEAREICSRPLPDIAGITAAGSAA